jgi:AAA15 family ATPase/GTPase
VAGDGLRRAFHFAVAAVGATSGVLLIDEIEAALHTSALSAVFSFLVRECAELGVQIFATTHSLETLDAIMAQSDSLVTYSLTPGGVRRISQADLKVVREEHGFDIR